MTIKFENLFYQSTECREAWLTSNRLQKSRLVTIWIPGYQYMNAINNEIAKRGLHLELR